MNITEVSEAAITVRGTFFPPGTISTRKPGRVFGMLVFVISLETCQNYSHWMLSADLNYSRLLFLLWHFFCKLNRI